MAIKKDKKEAPKKAEFRGFFNFEMDSEMKAACAAYMRKDEQIALDIENLLASGYSLKTTRDSFGNGYQATAQCYDTSDVNAGLCMSAFAKHWYDALAVLMFKHYYCLGKKWESDKAAPERGDFG